MYRVAIGAIVMVLITGCLAGCQSWSNTPPIESFANRLVDDAIAPAIKEGLTRGVDHLQIQAGAQVINPTYEVTFNGKWVVGVEGGVSVGVTGVSGQFQTSTYSPASDGSATSKPATETVHGETQ